MKKLLLTALLVVSALGAQAQSKATATVTLMSGMTAKLELNSTTSVATLTFTGPSDRWFALQFGSFANGGGMQSGADMVYYNGTTLVDCSMNGVGVTPSTDTNDWTTTSNTVSGTTRTIVATRAFAGGSDDYTFVYADANIDFAYAKASSASYTLSNHGGSNRGYKLNQAFSCIPPDAPTAAAQSFCGGATIANLTATGGTEATFKWYAAATGGTALAATTALTSTTYYVSQTLSACESTRTAVAVTVTTVGLPTSAASQSFCNSATVASLTATGVAGAELHWYAASTGGTALSASTALTTGTTYYVDQTSGTCTSERKAVSVTINTTALPTAAATQPFCGTATVASLTATGTALKWYSTIGGTALAQTAALSTGTYYVTQTLNSCESATKSVSVTVNPIPAAPTAAATQTFTAGETVANLEATFAAGATATWFMLNGSVYVTIPATTALQNGVTYYVSQTKDGCESSKTAITANAAAGVNSFTLKGLKAYPNPVSSVVTLSANSNLRSVVVNNILGQQVLTQTVNGTSAELNVSQLSAGTYIVKVSDEKGATATVKIVKQ